MLKPTVLLCGHDDMLLWTRTLLLSHHGYRVRSVAEFNGPYEAIARTRADVLLICQTCPPEELASLLDAALAEGDGLRLLLMSRSRQAVERLPGGIWRLDGRSPERLLDVVDQAIVEKLGCWDGCAAARDLPN